MRVRRPDFLGKRCDAAPVIFFPAHFRASKVSIRKTDRPAVMIPRTQCSRRMTTRGPKKGRFRLDLLPKSVDRDIDRTQLHGLRAATLLKFVTRDGLSVCGCK